MIETHIWAFECGLQGNNQLSTHQAWSSAEGAVPCSTMQQPVKSQDRLLSSCLVTAGLFDTPLTDEEIGQGKHQARKQKDRKQRDRNDQTEKTQAAVAGNRQLSESFEQEAFWVWMKGAQTEKSEIFLL